MRKILLTTMLASLLLACGRQSVGLPDFTGLVEEAAPAIVNISGTAPTGQAARPSEHPFYEWFRDFIEPESAPQAPPRDSLGSGFIISGDGEILTNNHVVADADEIIVTLADRRQLKAEVLGRDPASDLALLKIDASGLPTLEFGSSAELKVGAWVLAIGSPFGFEQTVTAGIVSAKRRALGSEQYVPYLQTDVAINPGNSGGPLFNLDGEVIGINSQIYSQTGGYMGLSFAVPADTAVAVISQLREFGKVRRGWLGVVIQEVDRDLAESFKLERATGALVSRVEPGSPAAEAGLQAGDVILSVDGEAVLNSGALPPMVGQHAPGDRVKLGLIRDGKSLSLKVTLRELDATPTAASNWTGLTLSRLSDNQRQRLRLSEGLQVEQVTSNSPAAEAGILTGDVLLSWAGESLEEVAQFNARADSLSRGAAAPLLLRRGERSLFLALKRPE